MRGLFLTVLIILSNLFAQNPEWTVYNISNSGLLHNRIKTIAIDDSGNIWLGIGGYFDGGLSFFDGISWIEYTTSNSGLPDNRISSLEIDDSGTKWIGTESGGLVSFDGTIWLSYIALRGGTARLSRRLNAHSRSGKRLLTRIIPMWL